MLLSTFKYLPLEVQVMDSAWNGQDYRFALEQHNVVLKQIAVDTGVYLFDFASDFPNEKEYFSVSNRYGRTYTDLFHVNKKGAELKAKMFARFLSESAGETIENHRK